MAVKRCPTCGDLYLAAVDVCADCGAALVEVEEHQPERAPVDEGRPSTDGEHSSWSLESWTMEGRRLLDGMLSSADIPRSWQGATLIAPAMVRDRVQDMVDTVGAGDARVGVDGASLAAVDADADDTVGYEVSDWSGEALDRLSVLLDERSIPHGWDDDGDLVVASAHEEVVDALFAELSDGASSDDEGGDGEDALAVLSQLFLAADRLARNALDAAAARSIHDAVDQLGGLRLPFGFAPAVWASILERAGALSDQIDDDEVDDDQLEVDAGALRDALRDYI